VRRVLGSPPRKGPGAEGLPRQRKGKSQRHPQQGADVQPKSGEQEGRRTKAAPPRLGGQAPRPRPQNPKNQNPHQKTSERDGHQPGRRRPERRRGRPGQARASGQRQPTAPRAPSARAWKARERRKAGRPGRKPAQGHQGQKRSPPTPARTNRRSAGPK